MALGKVIAGLGALALVAAGPAFAAASVVAPLASNARASAATGDESKQTEAGSIALLVLAAAAVAAGVVAATSDGNNDNGTSVSQ